MYMPQKPGFPRHEADGGRVTAVAPTLHVGKLMAPQGSLGGSVKVRFPEQSIVTTESAWSTTPLLTKPVEPVAPGGPEVAGTVSVRVDAFAAGATPTATADSNAASSALIATTDATRDMRAGFTPLVYLAPSR